MFNGRIVRSLLLALDHIYEQPINQVKAAEARQKTANIKKKGYDSHAKPLPKLTVGQRVVIYDENKNTWSIPGKVDSIDEHRQDR